MQSFGINMLLRSFFRTVSLSFGVGSLALSLLWLSLAASAALEGRACDSVLSIPATSAANQGSEDQNPQPPLTFFQPWSGQSNQGGWVEHSPTGPDHETPDGSGLFGRFVGSELATELPGFPRLRLLTRELLWGTFGFCRAP